jgi:hypothetical protein
VLWVDLTGGTEDVQSDRPTEKLTIKIITICGVPLVLLEIGEVAKIAWCVDTVRREIWCKNPGQFKLANR